MSALHLSLLALAAPESALGSAWLRPFALPLGWCFREVDSERFGLMGMLNSQPRWSEPLMKMIFSRPAPMTPTG